MNCEKCGNEMTRYGNQHVEAFLCEPCQNMMSIDKAATAEKRQVTQHQALDDVFTASTRLAKMQSRLTYARCELAYCMKAASRLEAEMQKAIERAAEIQEEKEELTR